MGANLGDREQAIHDALAHLAQTHGATVCAISRIIETEPWGETDQPRFMNACACIETDLSPLTLLNACKETEQALGRTPSRRWGPRAIDVDILLYGEFIFHSPELSIPHPLMHKRAFVLEPLNEIAPDAMHPTLHKTIRELLESL